MLLTPLTARAATGSAAVDTWYVVAAGACTFNGDGLASTCAASGGASGAFLGDATFSNLIWTNTTGIDDGDTLCIIGKHRGTLSPGNSGTVAAPITINLKCNGVTVGTITGANIESSWTGPDGNGNYTSGSSYTTPTWVLVDGVAARHGSSAAALTAGQWYFTGTTVLYRGSPTGKVIEIAVRGVAIDGSASTSSNLIITGGPASSTGVGATSGNGRIEATRLIASKGGITFNDCSNISVTGVVFYAHRGALDYRGSCTNASGLDSNYQVSAPSNITYERNRVSSTALGGTDNFLTNVETTHSFAFDRECIASTFAGNNIVARFNEVSDCSSGINFLPDTAVSGYEIVSNYVHETGLSGVLITNSTNAAITASLIAGNRIENIALASLCGAYGIVHTGATAGPGSYVAIVNNTIINAGSSMNINGTSTGNSTGPVMNNVSIQPSCASPNYHINMANWTNQSAAFINGNVYYHTGTSFWRSNIRNLSVYATYQSDITPQENASLNTDPLVISRVAPFNLKSQPTSPLRRAGKATGLCRELRGRVCYPDRPDIGAYQSTSGDLAAPRTARQ
jgi:hypothetical protein